MEQLCEDLPLHQDTEAIKTLKEQCEGAWGSCDVLSMELGVPVPRKAEFRHNFTRGCRIFKLWLSRVYGAQPTLTEEHHGWVRIPASDFKYNCTSSLLSSPLLLIFFI